MIKIKKNLAFTLAEVLITLGIIGVVAAMTIPTMISENEDRANKAAWKKTYSEISQVYTTILSENGFTAKDLFTGDKLGSTILATKLAEKMKFSKTCDGSATQGGTGSGSSVEGCWHAANKWRYLYGATKFAYDFPGAIALNGRLMTFEITKTDCSTSWGTATRCGAIFVDANGFKGPNQIGKDIFSAILLENRIVPNGTYASLPDTTCIEGSTATTNTGDGCSIKYLME